MEEKSTLVKILGVFGAIAIRVVVYVLIALVLIRGIKWSYDFGHDIFYSSAVEEAPGRDIEVTVEEGMKIDDVADMLIDKGLISNKIAFIVQSRFFELDVKPGRYFLNTSESSRQMLELMHAGPADMEGNNAGK